MSSSTSGPLRLAEEYLVRGDVKEALCIYQRISETEPTNLTIKSRLGELCALANQSSDAVKVLADVARTHIREGHTSEAAAVLRKIIKLSPSDPDMLMDIAGLLSRSGLSAEAERCYLSAADMFAGVGETAKLETAYEMASAVGPANPEVLMKFGALCHRSGRLADSYRAFMKAAAEYNRRGDDNASLDAYGKALKVAPSGAEAGNAVAEVMRHLGLGDSASAASRPRSTAERAAPPLPFPHGAVSAEPPAAFARSDGGRPASKAEATDDELLVGKISKAELLFGFGRFDQAIALLKELAEMKPNDPRVYRKLKDIYLRSEMPEEAGAVYRELARIYKDQGDEELSGDCIASARRLCGLPVVSETSPGAAGDQPSVVWQPLGEPKEPDLTLITPALSASPPAARYIPARHRTEPADPGTQPISEWSASSEETADTQAGQPPKVVVSTPMIAPIRISTPPLSGGVRQPDTVIESDYAEAGSGTPTPSGPFGDPQEQRPARRDGPVTGPKSESELKAPANPQASEPAMPHSSVLDPPQSAVPAAPHSVAPGPPQSRPGVLGPPHSATPAQPDSTLQASQESPQPPVNPSPTIAKLQGPAVSARAPIVPARVKAASGSTSTSSPSTLFGVQMDATSELEVEKPGKPRYWIAAVVAVVVLSGSAGGYLLVRRSQARRNAALQQVEAQATEVPVESPPVAAAPVEVNAVTAETTPESPERQPDGAASQVRKTADAAPQRQPQYEAVNTTPTPYQTPVVQQTQPAQQPRPTPPPTVGPVGVGPGGGGAPAVAPGALARELPTAPPPPPATPGPTARRAAVTAGGEVLRRVEPVYPQAARSAHITGTVTVELTINEQGNVVSARATSGPGMLAGAAESAARGFKFKPITLDGVSVKSSRTVLFHFKE